MHWQRAVHAEPDVAADEQLLAVAGFQLEPDAAAWCAGILTTVDDDLDGAGLVDAAAVAVRSPPGAPKDDADGTGPQFGVGNWGWTHRWSPDVAGHI